MQGTVKTEVTNSTLVIQLDRLSAKNALSLSMYRQLTAALIQLDQDPNLTSAVIYGSEQCFTAGNDLKDFLSGGELNRNHPTVELLYQLAETKKPLIAAVAGPAIGIGTTMLLHCDLVVASTNSIFQLPFAKLGLCPEAASSYLLPSKVGHQVAFELLVLGERFDAVKAESLGLVNKVVAEDTCLEQATIYAEQIAKLPADAVTSSKALMRSDKDKTEQILKLELAQFQRLMDSEEATQIISSFFKS